MKTILMLCVLPPIIASIALVVGFWIYDQIDSKLLRKQL